MYRGCTAADESTVSYASGHSDAESLGAEILAMARANQPAPSLPTIDESSAVSVGGRRAAAVGREGGREGVLGRGSVRGALGWKRV